ncbi:MAG TPA: hypothetical protein VN381_07760 [Anaerovoracaceae bacterium]|nr:hypothetical protein [Anaerovoracaceae bacterium]
MEVKTDQFSRIKDYTNILITDENGAVLFYDTPDLGILKSLGLNPNDLIGRRITSCC